MFEDHPSGNELESFLKNASGTAARARNAQVVRHLLSECAVCRDRLRTMGWDGKRLVRLIQIEGEGTQSPTAQGFDYSRAFAAAEQSVAALLTPERLEAETPESLLAGLGALPPDQQVRRAGTDGRFATPGVVKSLIDRSHKVRYKDADTMLHFARLARVAAEACTSEAAGNGLRLADLKARAWGQYGNALRVTGRSREAMEALSMAQDHRKQGTGDPVLRAWLLEKITPMAIFQGQYGKAIQISGEAGEIYQELGEDHLLASTLVQKAIAALYSSETESAVRMLNQAIPLIDYEEDPHLLLAACHNLIRCYIDLDQPEQALRLYSETHELYQEFDDPLIRLRADWQEGQILRDLGHLRAAEAALLRARQGYMERKLVYEAASVSLELATVYVKLGLVEELKSTVTATIPIFHALRVKLETLAALLQLRQMADQEHQALELIRVLSAQIDLAQEPADGIDAFRRSVAFRRYHISLPRVSSPFARRPGAGDSPLENHPTAEDFERFLQANPQPSNAGNNARIVRHLLDGCRVCRETLDELRGGRALLSRLLEIPLPQEEAGDSGRSRFYNYDWAFARTERAAAASLVRGGPARGLPERLAELYRLPEGEQIRRVSLGGRFANPELIETLIERSHAARYQSPRKMLHLARLARLAADACTVEMVGSPERLADLRAQALQAYGNSQRLCGNLPEAEEAFTLALQSYEEGSGSAYILAQLYSQMGALRMFQRRFEESIQLAEKSGLIFSEIGQTRDFANTMVQKATYMIYAGEAEAAVGFLRQATPLIDREEDPQVFLAAYHNLVRCYIDLDQPEEALATFVEAKPLYQECKDPLILLKATWQEGQLLREIGHLESAEATLLRARQGLSEQGLAYEAALVCLDLADVYAKLGGTEDLRRTVTEAMPIFRSLRVGREVLASLLRLREAAGLETPLEG